MTVLNQIVRPLSWLNSLKLRRTQSDTAGTVSAVAANLASVEASTGQLRWVNNRVMLPRRLDASCYQELLTVTHHLYSSGRTELVLDLRNVEQIELTGLFALHCIALAMRGNTVPAPEQGWHALRTVVEMNLAAGRCEQVKLVNGSAHIIARLEANHLDHCLCIVQSA